MLTKRRPGPPHRVASAPFAAPAGTWEHVPVALDATVLAVGREDGGWAVVADIPGGRAWPRGWGDAELTLVE